MNKQADSSHRLDWIIFALRWLLIATALIALGSGSDFTPDSIAVTPQAMGVAVALAAIYNIVFAALLFVGLSGSALKLITMIGDAGVAVLFFWASGGSSLILVGMGLFAIIIATLRYGRTSGLLIAATIGLAALGIQSLIGQVANHWYSLLIGILFLFLTAALTSLVSGSEQVARRLSESDWESDANSLKSSRERARAIYEMASTLGATLDYNKVLEAALDVGTIGLREMGPDVRLVAMVLLFNNDQLHVATSRRLTRQDEKVTVPGRTGILGLAFKQAEPVFANSAVEDPELSFFASLQDSKSILAIPLRAGFDHYGILLYSSPKPNAFSDDHVELLTAIGTQATIALQNAVLYQNLRMEKERIVEIEEDARKKLARDLHDGPTQGVAAIAMRVNYIRRVIVTKPQVADEELQKVEDLARRTTKEIRHMLFTLRPLVLETQGLSAALRQYAEKVKETHGLDVTIEAQPGVDELLDGNRQGVLFYIVEEAVGNARKHAQAKNIVVSIDQEANCVVVAIKDDGVGFDVESVNTNYEKRGSLGMVNMRERAALVEGTLQLESAPGKGTKISVFVPIKADSQPMTVDRGRNQGTRDAIMRAAQPPSSPRGH